MTRPQLLSFVLIVAMLLSASAEAASHRRRHRSAAVPPPAPVQQPFMFYPQNIEGGVAGNLPFNNQIRKHTDPLNANGGR